MQTHSKWLRLAAAIGLGVFATDVLGYPDISTTPLETESPSDSDDATGREGARDEGTAA